MNAATTDASIRAWLQIDMKDRQRAVLAVTFPEWDFAYWLGGDGHWVWSAAARSKPTLEMATDGVLREVRRGDPVELMAALTLQESIIERHARH